MKFYTYLHYLVDTDELCYVGSGNENRPHTPKRKVAEHARLMRKKKIRVEIIAEYEDKKSAQIAEQQLLDKWFGKAPLFNRSPYATSKDTIEWLMSQNKILLKENSSAGGITRREKHKDKLSEWGALGGSIAAKKLNSMRYMCLVCGMIASPGSIGRHQKASNHTGREKQ